MFEQQCQATLREQLKRNDELVRELKRESAFQYVTCEPIPIITLTGDKDKDEAIFIAALDKLMIDYINCQARQNSAVKARPKQDNQD